MLNQERSERLFRPWIRSVGLSVALAAAAVLAAAPGCQSGSSLPRGSASVRFGEGRRTAEVSMTGVLHVELLGNAGTGFDWQLSANDPSLFEPIGQPHVTPLDPGVMGGRTITTFEFRPLRPGQATIDFQYVRPREWNEPPGKVAQVEAKVTGGGS